MRDTVWLIFVGRLPLRAVILWSCFVTTKKCTMENCDEVKTLDHLLISCYRMVEIRQKMDKLSFDIENNTSSKIWFA